MDMAPLYRRPVLNSVCLKDGRSLAYAYHSSPKKNAPTLLFVHGFPLDHSMWQEQIPLRGEANLLIPDLAGFGKSDPRPEPLTLGDLANDLAELLDRLDIPQVIWCGLSMGGYIGWEFVHQYRQRLTGLICCNTRSGADAEPVVRARKVAAAQVLGTGATPVADAMQEKLFSPSTHAENNDLVRQSHSVIQNTSSASIAAGQLAMAARKDSSSLLSTLSLPTLVIAGEHDSITTSSEMQEMAMLVDGATFVEIMNAGHLSPAEQPLVFNRAVTHWLDQIQN